MSRVGQKATSDEPVHGRRDAPKQTQDLDGTKIEVWEDGFRFQSNADGSSVEIWVDGSTLYRTVDGTQQLKKPDGYLRQTQSDGMMIEVWADGRQKQTNVDGKVIDRAADGTVTHYTEDGTVLGATEADAAVSSDGVEVTTLADGTQIARHSDGRKVVTYTSGIVKTEETDGSWEQVMPNGSTIAVKTDGSQIQTNADGTSIETDADGVQTQVHANGTRLVVQEDGSVMQTDASGVRTFRRKDGTVVSSSAAPASPTPPPAESSASGSSASSSRRRSTFVRRSSSAPSVAAAERSEGAAAPAQALEAALAAAAALAREKEELLFAMEAKANALRDAKRRLKKMEKKEEVRLRCEAETGGGSDDARGDRVLKSKLKAVEARFSKARETINAKERRIAELEARLSARGASGGEAAGEGGGDDADGAVARPRSSSDDGQDAQLAAGRSVAAMRARVFAQTPSPSALQLLRAARARVEAEDLSVAHEALICVAIDALAAPHASGAARGRTAWPRGMNAEDDDERHEATMHLAELRAVEECAAEVEAEAEAGEEAALPPAERLAQRLAAQQSRAETQLLAERADEAAIGGSAAERWVSIASFGDAHAATALAATCRVLRRALVASPPSLYLWQEQLVRLTTSLFGARAVDEVGAFLVHEAHLQTRTNPFLTLCARVARSAAIGVPLLGAGKGEDSDSDSDDDDDASHVVIELGSTAIRVGANCALFEDAPVVIDVQRSRLVRRGGLDGDGESGDAEVSDEEDSDDEADADARQSGGARAVVQSSGSGGAGNGGDGDEAITVEEALRLAGRRLMGSEHYLSGVSVLLLEGNSLWTRVDESQIIECLFETFRVASVRLARSGETGIVGFGETSGVIIDGGTDFISICPVFDMCALSYAKVVLPFGGRTVSQRLQRTLQSRGLDLPLNDALRGDPAKPARSVEWVKRSVCCVRPSPASDDGGAARVEFPCADAAAPATIELSSYERSEPAEVLFNPSVEGMALGGLADAVWGCVQRCPIDTRRALLGAVCLTGGCCAIPGVAERLQRELDELANSADNASAVDVRSPVPAGDAPHPAQRTALFGNCAYRGGHVMVSMLDSETTADGFVELNRFEHDPFAATRALTGH